MDEEENGELILKRLMKEFTVKSFVIMNKQAIPIKSLNLEPDKATHYAGAMSELEGLCRRFLQQEQVVEVIPEDQNELTSIRLRTKKREIVVAPGNEYTVIVLDDPEEEPEDETEKEEED